MELGNWYNGGWRVADADQSISGNSIQFTFRPINAHEYPDLDKLLFNRAVHPQNPNHLRSATSQNSSDSGADGFDT